MDSNWRISKLSRAIALKSCSKAWLSGARRILNALLHRIINFCPNSGELVLDPFSGTFATGAATLDSGRNFIGIEQDARYCRFGHERLSQCVDRNGPIENAVYDEKPPKISLHAMLETGFLQSGEKIYAKAGRGSAILQPDGKIKMPDGKITDIHAGAVIIKNGKAQRLNGFGVWQVIRNGMLAGIDEIRELARKSQPD